MAFNNKEFNRKANWTKAEKHFNKTNSQFLWIPVSYENDVRPGVVVYDKDTEYRLKFAKYYTQPILEGLVVVRQNGKFDAFLAQIAYDPNQVSAAGHMLSQSNFTGTLIKADWSNTAIGIIRYYKGSSWCVNRFN